MQSLRLMAFTLKGLNKMSFASPKKQCADFLSIGTHDGTFHCDEVFACWMLKQLPRFKNASIIRTRDNAKLSQCSIVVDVGGVYDPEKYKFDHHQRTFSGTMKSLGSMKWETKLSSAGLIYLHMGKEVISEITSLPQNDVIVSRLYEKLYEKFVEEIDAVDNGIDQYEGSHPKYQVTTTLSSRVAGLNPAWNDGNQDATSGFYKALDMVGLEFLDRIHYYKDAWLPARKIVEDAIDERYSVDESGEVIVFHQSGCPWKEHLFDIEIEKNIVPNIKFVLYQDQNHNWRVQSVPERLGSFENRLSLCESWRGLRDDILSSTSGIPGCIFVHASGFIGGNKTYEGALQMAKHTLKA
ncbi:MYG1 exonuclease isoform X2 [Hydra vulgaris]|uniref:MYG1 exonuclease isoform X2 n=1 Tax=Hydra vulgaris TaxID=6087 RepID=A0ABM4BYH9_HYDVU